MELSRNQLVITEITTISRDRSSQDCKILQHMLRDGADLTMVNKALRLHSLEDCLMKNYRGTEIDWQTSTRHSSPRMLRSIDLRGH